MLNQELLLDGDCGPSSEDADANNNRQILDKISPEDFLYFRVENGYDPVLEEDGYIYSTCEQFDDRQSDQMSSSSIEDDDSFNSNNCTFKCHEEDSQSKSVKNIHSSSDIEVKCTTIWEVNLADSVKSFIERAKRRYAHTITGKNSGRKIRNHTVSKGSMGFLSKEATEELRKIELIPQDELVSSPEDAIDFTEITVKILPSEPTLIAQDRIDNLTEPRYSSVATASEDPSILNPLKRKRYIDACTINDSGAYTLESNESYHSKMDHMLKVHEDEGSLRQEETKQKVISGNHCTGLNGNSNKIGSSYLERILCSGTIMPLKEKLKSCIDPNIRVYTPSDYKHDHTVPASKKETVKKTLFETVEELSKQTVSVDKTPVKLKEVNSETNQTLHKPNSDSESNVENQKMSKHTQNLSKHSKLTKKTNTKENPARKNDQERPLNPKKVFRLFRITDAMKNFKRKYLKVKIDNDLNVPFVNPILQRHGISEKSNFQSTNTNISESKKLKTKNENLGQHKRMETVEKKHKRINIDSTNHSNGPEIKNLLAANDENKPLPATHQRSVNFNPFLRHSPFNIHSEHKCMQVKPNNKASLKTTEDQTCYVSECLTVSNQEKLRNNECMTSFSYCKSFDVPAVSYAINYPVMTPYVKPNSTQQLSGSLFSRHGIVSPVGIQFAHGVTPLASRNASHAMFPDYSLKAHAIPYRLIPHMKSNSNNQFMAPTNIEPNVDLYQSYIDPLQHIYTTNSAQNEQMAWMMQYFNNERSMNAHVGTPTAANQNSSPDGVHTANDFAMADTETGIYPILQTMKANLHESTLVPSMRQWSPSALARYAGHLQSKSINWRQQLQQGPMFLNSQNYMGCNFDRQQAYSSQQGPTNTMDRWMPNEVYPSQMHCFPRSNTEVNPLQEIQQYLPSDMAPSTSSSTSISHDQDVPQVTKKGRKLEQIIGRLREGEQSL